MHALGEADGDGGAGGSSATSSSTAASSSSSGTARWIIPQSAASRAADRPAEQQHLLGPGHADEPGQQPGGAAVGGEPPLGERHPEAAVVGGDGEVGGERDLAAEARPPSPRTAHTTGSWISMSSAMRRWAWSGVRRWMLPVRGLRRRRRRWPATQSAPAQKSSPALREEHGPQRVVGGRRLERLDHRARLAGDVERALALRPVDDEAQHAVVGLDHDAGGRRPSLIAPRRHERRCRARAAWSSADAEGRARAPRPA